MRCLCCGKELKKEEEKTGWHTRCIKKFFHTAKLPLLELNDKTMETLANAAVNKGLTVPGVQKKISLHLSLTPESRLTLVDYPTGYILKPQSHEFSYLPECEHMVMTMSDRAGLHTAEHALIRMQEGQLAYITKRMDRNITLDRTHKEFVSFYAMEDFCQLSGRLTSDKYHSSYERCASIIKKYSDQPGLDMAEFFMRIVFSFLTGNSDMHLKNFSLIEKEPGSRKYKLSDAYDMLAVNLVLPEDQEETALTLNGKKRNIRRKDFLMLADKCGIPQNAAENMIKELIGKKNVLMDVIDNSFLPETMKTDMKSLMGERFSRLLPGMSH